MDLTNVDTVASVCLIFATLGTLAYLAYDAFYWRKRERANERRISALESALQKLS